MFKVILDSCGNIDRGENPYQQVEGAWRMLVSCDSIEKCQEVVRDYILEHRLGSSQWDGGEVFDKENNYLGYISYNCRFWKGETK